MQNEFRDYLTNWLEASDIEACNEPEFVEGFIEFLLELEDEDDVTLIGCVDDFGKSVVVHEGSARGEADEYAHGLGMEITYSEDLIAVSESDNDSYEGRHYYLHMDHNNKDFIRVQNAIYTLLSRYFGVPITLS